jgi:hypothetical protein
MNDAPGPFDLDLSAVAEACGDARHEGRGRYRCCCPSCGGNNCCLYEGHDGRLRVDCYSCGEWKKVRAALVERKLIPATGGRITLSAAGPSRAETIAWARKVWGHDDTPFDQHRQEAFEGSISSEYLKRRGIAHPHPWWRVLRHQFNLYHSGTERRLSAMMARVDHVDRGFVAVEVTYLDGLRIVAVEPSRRTYGPKPGGGVWFGEGGGADELVVGEGVETTLSAMRLFGAGWGVATLSTAALKALVLPGNVRQILIAADNDANGVGQEAAEFARARFRRLGRAVRVATPETPDTDFNDLLTRGNKR